MAKTIQEKLLAIQTELKAPKDKYNSFGKYHYRSAESILEALKQILPKYDATLTIEEDLVSTERGEVIKAVARLYDTKELVSMFAVAFAGIEKAGGMALPQAYGSASSYAKKYALGNLFLIDDTQDADATNDHGRGGAGQSKPKSRPAEKAKLTPSSDSWKKAVGALKADSSKLASIKKFYDLSAANEKKLKQEAGI